MPPKKSVPKEHNVYIITHHKYGDDDDEIGNLEIVQAHATLEEANTYAEAKVDEVCEAMDIETPESGPDNFINLDNFHMRVNLPKGSFAIEVVTQPLLGGTITPKAPPKQKKKAAPKKSKAKHVSEDEDDMDDDVNDELEEPTLSTNGKKRKASAPLDEEEDGDENISQADIHAAPSGAAGCLEGESFLVTGTLSVWTRDEIHALIEMFGGTIEKSVKASLSYVVLGAQPGAGKLGEIKSKALHTISQTALYQLIRDSPGGEMISSEEVAKACKKAKGKTTAAKNAKKAAKKATEEVDEEE